MENNYLPDKLVVTCGGDVFRDSDLQEQGYIIYLHCDDYYFLPSEDISVRREFVHGIEGGRYLIDTKWGELWTVNQIPQIQYKNDAFDHTQAMELGLRHICIDLEDQTFFCWKAQCWKPFLTPQD